MAAKWRLAKLLYGRSWDKQQIINLFSVIDWMMNLPEELQLQLWQEIEYFERNCAMPYITSVERIGINKGILQGRAEGKLEGKLEGETILLERLITRRFAPPNGETLTRLKSATLEQLEQWAENILDADTLEDVFKSH